MSGLGLQSREVWEDPDRLPTEKRLGISENIHHLFWHAEPSILRKKVASVMWI
jgi:hypothetical protein